jgi:NAD kinase
MKSVLVAYNSPASAQEKKGMEIVRIALKENDLRSEWVERSGLSPSHAKGKDLAFSIGGDGTFLLTAHILAQNVPLLGINSDPKTKEGYFLSANAKTFPSILKEILGRNVKLNHLPTLESKVNGKKIPLAALNEFFIGASRAYRTSRYNIKVKGKEEVHRSSGIIAATPLGVHAWVSSAIGMNIQIPEQSFMYVVREPYERRVFSDYHLKRGVLKRGEKLTIVSKMQDGVIVADSLGKEYPLRFNDRVEIMLSKRTVTAIQP